MSARHALDRLRLRIRRWLVSRTLPIWYDRAFRLPISALEAQAGIEPRRADFVAWYLIETGHILPGDLRVPRRVTLDDLARVHSDEYLEDLSRPETLAHVFAVDPSDIPVDEVMHTTRLACGATLGAARAVLKHGGPALNLLGGFHHAAPRHGAALCAVNDMAVAIAALREEGYRGRTVILDLDAHPPDGTAECVEGDPSVWIGSLSASDWKPLPGVDETLLPVGTGDAAYLEALDALLARMPRGALAFVIAGGDVLGGDRFGCLGLTLAGARQRDLRVLDALEDVPSVWLPGGGYHRDAWRVLAGTALALLEHTDEPVPADYDPLRHHYAGIFDTISRQDLGATLDLSAAEIEESLGLGRAAERRLLGYYTAHGVEHALFRYGILQHIQRLGYGRFRVDIDKASAGGDRLRVTGCDDSATRHVLIECVLQRREVGGRQLLYVHWLVLRNPRARFSERRPQLPGQDAPGLGLAREIGEVLARVAKRLGLGGLSFRPGHYHVAYAARYRLRFLDPVRQGRFEALQRDLRGVSLLEASLALAAGRARLNGEPYAWEPEVMVSWNDGHIEDPETVAAERERAHFTLAPE